MLVDIGEVKTAVAAIDMLLDSHMHTQGVDNEFVPEWLNNIKKQIEEVEARD